MSQGTYIAYNNYLAELLKLCKTASPSLKQVIRQHYKSLDISSDAFLKYAVDHMPTEAIASLTYQELFFLPRPDLPDGGYIVPHIPLDSVIKSSSRQLLIRMVPLIYTLATITEWFGSRFAENLDPVPLIKFLQAVRSSSVNVDDVSVFVKQNWNGYYDTNDGLLISLLTNMIKFLIDTNTNNGLSSDSDDDGHDSQPNVSSPLDLNAAIPQFAQLAQSAISALSASKGPQNSESSPSPQPNQPNQSNPPNQPKDSAQIELDTINNIRTIMKETKLGGILKDVAEDVDMTSFPTSASALFDMSNYSNSFMNKTLKQVSEKLSDKLSKGDFSMQDLSQDAMKIMSTFGMGDAAKQLITSLTNNQQAQPQSTTQQPRINQSHSQTSQASKQQQKHGVVKSHK